MKHVSLQKLLPVSDLCDEYRMHWCNHTLQLYIYVCVCECVLADTSNQEDLEIPITCSLLCIS